jgi:serine/threonine protein kinase/tetratricopeptide (TPR) repeat protein
MASDDDRSTTMVGFVSGGTATDSLATPRIAGRYEIQALLGTGGMGSVYRVRDVELDELVALKVLRADIAETSGILARFRQEVKLARRVAHPNVVRTFDLGEIGTERFLTMEYIDGISLSKLLEDQGPLPIARAVAIGRQICAGVGAAHDAGVLHRDLKPDNVMIASSDGRAVITDFGIARARTEAALANTIGGVVGTPAYMAPEQVTAGADVGPTADVYAIGAMLFEMLTGRRAWPGNEPFAVALARLTLPPPDPRLVRPSLPEPIAAVVLRCLARDPAARFPTAGAVAEALEVVGDAPRPAVEASFVTPIPVTRAAEGPRPDARAVAVLPFKTGSPDDAFTAEGLAEELTDALTMTPGLRVRPSGGVASTDARAAGRALDVDVVVEGSLRRHGDTIRILARVIHVADGFQLWARRFDTTAAELLVTVDAVAQAIADALTVDRPRQERVAATDPDAIELYLRGRAEMRRHWTTTIDVAVTTLTEAHRRAPGDAAILAALALSEARGAWSGGDEFVRRGEIARTHADAAVALAPELGDAWVALAYSHWVTGDAAAAGRALMTARAKAPGVARVHEMIGVLLLEAGEIERALRHLETALALDPGQRQPHFEILRAHALLGRWSRVDVLLDLPMLDDSERFGNAFYRTRFALWRRDPALLGPPLPDISGLPQGMQLAWRYLVEARHLLQTGVVSDIQMQLLLAQVAQKRGPRLVNIQAQAGAEMLAFGGKFEQAAEMVDRGTGNRLLDIVWMDRCPLLEPLRSDPRWPEWYARVAANAAAVREALREG